MRTQSSPRWQFGLLLSIVLAALYVASGHAPVQAEADVDQDPAEPGMLVMKSGDVVSGRILRNGHDYLVKLPSGQMFVPSTLVRLRCTDIHDAYRQLRIALPENHGAESHMALARWCLTQKLYSDARQELKDALLMEPDRTEAQDMLERLNTMIDPTTAEQKADAPAIVEASRKMDRFDEVESLGGLPREAAVQYVRHIQPLLNNQCALSGCHGPREEGREFRLQRFVGGQNRHTVERNLASVLKFIDLENPKDSPLLIKPKGNHGRRGRSIFVGSRGAEQYNDLRDWVLNVAANRDEQPRSSTARKVTSRRGGGKIRTAAHIKPVREDKPANADALESEPYPALSPARRNGKQPSHATDQTASAPLDTEHKVLAPVAKDPFDPAEFNQQSGK